MLVNGGITYEKIEKITLTTIYTLLSLIFSFVLFSILNIDFKWWTTLAISISFMYTYLSIKNKTN